jgi:fucose 4-O-acetylase-like acetyltransferase
MVPLTLKRLAGGRELYGWFDVFWFVTCLFICQQIFTVVLLLCAGRISALAAIMAGLYSYTIIRAYIPEIGLPVWWGLNTAPMALLFLITGRIFPERILFNRATLLWSIVFFIACIFLDVRGVFMHEFKMKWEAYGIPGVNILTAVSGIVFVCACAHGICRVRYLGTVFREMGKASMIIMFLHVAVRQLVFDRLPDINNAWISIPVTIAVCCAGYAVCLRQGVLRVLFLGREGGRRTCDPEHALC